LVNIYYFKLAGTKVIRLSGYFLCKLLTIHTHTITLMKLKIYDVKLKVSQLQESSQFSEIIDLALLLKPLLDLGKLLNFICDCYYDQDQGELSNLKLNLMMIKLIIIFYSYSYCDGQTQ